MTLNDIFTSINIFINDKSTDRVTEEDRFIAATEATAWLLEELGNEHMVDRADIEFLPTVTWYKMDNLTPYLLTAGQLRFKEEDDHSDFTRVEARELVDNNNQKYQYAIERFNDDSYIGINVPNSSRYPHLDLIPFTSTDGLTYTGINADNIVAEKDAVRFDMQNTGQSSTGLSTTSQPINIQDYETEGVFIFEFEIPDVQDVTSVTLKFGTNLSTDYYAGTVSQDVNGNNLVPGVNVIKVPWSTLTLVGAPDLTAVTRWSIVMNHATSKPLVDGLKVSDLRIAKPTDLTFKYIFYRVGKDNTGDDIIEFSATTDVPFFANRYPQYKFAVAHKAAAILYRSMHLFENASTEEREAKAGLTRYRKNFQNERDTGSSAFKPAGISFRNRRLVRRNY